MATPQRSKAVSASATATECRGYKAQRRRRLKVPANRKNGRVGSPSGPKIQARTRRCGKKHSLTKSRGTRRNLPQGRSGAEKVEGGEWPRMIGGLTSVSAQVSGANAPSQGEWASRPHRTSLVGGTPTLLEGARRHDALPLIWVVSAKQPYHFFYGCGRPTLLRR